jgi:curved DNA-binding protein CbpA
MLFHYLKLGLSMEASDTEIRKRYLDLVREYPPEKDPDRFQEFTMAYEAVKDERSRIRAALFGGFEGDFERDLRSLISIAGGRKKRVGWKALVKTVQGASK